MKITPIRLRPFRMTPELRRLRMLLHLVAGRAVPGDLHAFQRRETGEGPHDRSGEAYAPDPVGVHDNPKGR